MEVCDLIILKSGFDMVRTRNGIVLAKFRASSIAQLAECSFRCLSPLELNCFSWFFYHFMYSVLKLLFIKLALVKYKTFLIFFLHVKWELPSWDIKSGLSHENKFLKYLASFILLHYNIICNNKRFWSPQRNKYSL